MSARLWGRRQPPAPESAAPKSPRGTVESSFAGILDGQSLWAAVADQPGSLALRSARTGDVIGLPNDVDQAPGYLATRVDLSELPWADVEGTQPSTGDQFELVLVPTNGRAPRPVWVAPQPFEQPAPAPDGHSRYLLARSEAGELHVRREPLPPVVILERIEVTGPDLRLHLSDANPHPEGNLHLVDDGGEVLVSVPIAPDGTAVLAAAALPTPRDVGTRVLVGAPEAWLPVGRRRNDLPNPGHAVPLPEVYGEQGLPLLRLRWSSEATLTARLLAPEEPS